MFGPPHTPHLSYVFPEPGTISQPSVIWLMSPILPPALNADCCHVKNIWILESERKKAGGLCAGVRVLAPHPHTATKPINRPIMRYRDLYNKGASLSRKKRSIVR